MMHLGNDDVLAFIIAPFKFYQSFMFGFWLNDSPQAPNFVQHSSPWGKVFDFVFNSPSLCSELPVNPEYFLLWVVSIKHPPDNFHVHRNHVAGDKGYSGGCGFRLLLEATSLPENEVSLTYIRIQYALNSAYLMIKITDHLYRKHLLIGPVICSGELDKRRNARQARN